MYEDVKNIISELRSRHTGYTDFPMELKRQVYSIMTAPFSTRWYPITYQTICQVYIIKSMPQMAF